MSKDTVAALSPSDPITMTLDELADGLRHYTCCDEGPWIAITKESRESWRDEARIFLGRVHSRRSRNEPGRGV